MTRQRFLARLAAIAQLTNTTLTKEIVGLYDETLGRHGYDKACFAIEETIRRRRSRDPMPSIADLESLVRPAASDEDLAIESANRVIEAMAKVGKYDAPRAEAFIGEIGWTVVQRAGGWSHLCSTTLTSQIPTLRAQLRELARTVINLSKAGVLNKPPSFSQIQAPQRLKSLVAGTIKSIGGTNDKKTETETD